MNEIDALFDKRSVVGARLESLLTEREYSKSGFCKACGISKSTLDKILNGMICSKTDYKKYMRKILGYLNITPEILIGNAVLTNSRTRQFRSILHIEKEELAEAIDVSIGRLEEIEAGSQMTKAELRDLAVYFGTSTHCILGQNVFYPQTTEKYDLVSRLDDADAELSGFWGYFGVMLSNSTEYIWYPITKYEAVKARFMMNCERAVIPCMNNTLLYINLKRIKSIVLLDDACDFPYYYNWDSSLEEGELPSVVFEVLDDYFFDTSENYVNDTEYSQKLQKFLNMLIKEKNWTEEDAHHMINGIRIIYADGKTVENNLENTSACGGVSGLAYVVRNVYIMDYSVEPDEYVSFTDWNGAVTCINMNEVSAIEMPLIAVEKMIIEREKRRP